MICPCMKHKLYLDCRACQVQWKRVREVLGVKDCVPFTDGKFCISFCSSCVWVNRQAEFSPSGEFA